MFLTVVDYPLIGLVGYQVHILPLAHLSYPSYLVFREDLPGGIVWGIEIEKADPLEDLFQPVKVDAEVGLQGDLREIYPEERDEAFEYTTPAG
jgi:hypothetical protein